LRAADRRALKDRRQGRERLSIRAWRRIRILELLDRGWKLAEVAAAVGAYPREVRRVGWRYLERGLETALSDDPRPKPARMLDARQQAAIVAMVCGPPPAGRARWTIVLTAHEAKRRGIIAKVGRETIRRLFASHELKPWREKMWCVPKLDAEYVARMEEVLEVLSQPLDERAPFADIDQNATQDLADPIVISQNLGQRRWAKTVQFFSAIYLDDLLRAFQHHRNGLTGRL